MRTGSVQTFYTSKMQIAPELEKVQGLMPVDPADRANLKDDIKKHGVREPIKGYMQGRTFFILAGATRHSIAQELNIETLPVEVLSSLPEKEREQFCIDDNVNRRHLTREQIRGLIDRELKQNPAQSDNLIAKKTKASDKTVTARREVLEARSEIPKVKEKAGADGKTYRKPEKKAPQIAQNRSGGARKGGGDIVHPDKKAKQESPYIIYTMGAALYSALDMIKKRKGRFDEPELKDISKQLCNITRELVFSLKEKERAAFIAKLKAEL